MIKKYNIIILIFLMFTGFYLIIFYQLNQYYKNQEIKIIEEKNTELENIEKSLVNLVESACSMLEESYNNTLKNFSLSVEDEIEEIISMLNINRIIFTLDNLRYLKLEKGNYISISEYSEPYTVRLHPEKSVLEGSDWNFQVNKENPINIYELFHNTIENSEEIVYYDYFELSSDSITPMVGAVKYFEALDWVVSSSINIDKTNSKYQNKMLDLESNFKKLVIKISIFYWTIFFVNIFILIKFIGRRNKITNLK